MGLGKVGKPKIVSAPSDIPVKVGFYLPNEPIKRFPDSLGNEGKRTIFARNRTTCTDSFLFDPAQQVTTPYNLRDAEFIVGLQFDGIFRLGRVYNSGNRSHGTVGGVQKKTIDAYPPYKGQTLLQFLLSLPQVEEIMFSFSMGLLNENADSDGVSFAVFLNGQNRFEHFTKAPGWTDAQILLSEYAGETVLFELVTDSGEKNDWDQAHWADLFITAKGVESNGDVNQDGSVNVLDIILVAQNLGQKPPSNPRADVNKDGQVNILDLVFVAERLGEKVVSAAPSLMDIVKDTPSSPVDVIVVQRALRELEAVPEKSQSVKITIQFLHALVGERQSKRIRDETPPELPQSLQSRDVDSVSVGKSGRCKCDDLRCRWAFGSDSFCWVQTCGILPYTRTSSLLGWSE